MAQQSTTSTTGAPSHLAICTQHQKQMTHCSLAQLVTSVCLLLVFVQYTSSYLLNSGGSMRPRCPRPTSIMPSLSHVADADSVATSVQLPCQPAHSGCAMLQDITQLHHLADHAVHCTVLGAQPLRQLAVPASAQQLRCTA
jgi:hypothetical protein